MGEDTKSVSLQHQGEPMRTVEIIVFGEKIHLPKFTNVSYWDTLVYTAAI